MLASSPTLLWSCHLCLAVSFPFLVFCHHHDHHYQFWHMCRQDYHHQHHGQDHHCQLSSKSAFSSSPVFHLLHHSLAVFITKAVNRKETYNNTVQQSRHQGSKFRLMFSHFELTVEHVLLARMLQCFRTSPMML